LSADAAGAPNGNVGIRENSTTPGFGSIAELYKEPRVEMGALQVWRLMDIVHTITTDNIQI
jgi:hypothetical protein